MRRCLIIFAKEPVKGKVKTRLNDYLSKEECFNLYKAFLKDTIELTKKIRCKDKILAYDSDKYPDYLKKIAPDFIFYKQNGKDLGMRMHNALKFVIRDNSSKVVIIGSDLPTLPASSIKKAFDLLNRADLVLGPSLDGGYYLIGLKSPCIGLFKGITWSSAMVFQETINRTKKLKKSIAFLDKRYDIDDIESLFRLQSDLKRIKNKKTAKWTRKFLKSVIQLTDKNDKIV